MNSEKQDIRWKQRFVNYKKALVQLHEFLVIDQMNKYEAQGLIKAFEYTYELAWNVMRDYLKEKGFDAVVGSRDAIMYAFREGIIENGEQWMEMFKHRNLTVHTYNEDTADEMATAIIHTYTPLFDALEAKMNAMS